jgi:hypothetical protein
MAEGGGNTALDLALAAAKEIVSQCTSNGAGGGGHAVEGECTICLMNEGGWAIWLLRSNLTIFSRDHSKSTVYA